MPHPFLLAVTIASLLPINYVCNAFLSPTHTTRHRSSSVIPTVATAATTTQLHVVNDGAQPDAPKTIEEDAALQWKLFTQNHALDGEWWGTWSTYNYMGDVEDSTVAGISLQQNTESDSVTHTHRILSSSTSSDCETCFDSSQVTALPTIATYTPESLGRRHRCAAVGMVVGPSLLKSGAVSTELALRHGDGRVRVTFQHAPVWERGVEPGSCPPQGLKLYRALVSKERLRGPGDAGEGPPSAEEERSSPPPAGEPRFFRPVPPFKWHAKWSGTSWTWGPQTGDRGWAVSEVDEADAWHGRPTGDAAGTWSLRLPGGVLVQCPRVIVGGAAGLCRLAWLPEDDGEEGTPEDGSRARLLRVEASVSALEPIPSELDEDMMVGFYPPTLGSLRTDILEKEGELEGVSLEERAEAAEGYAWGGGDASVGDATSENAAGGEAVGPVAEEEGSSSSKTEEESASPPLTNENAKEAIAADPRNALDL